MQPLNFLILLRLFWILLDPASQKASDGVTAQETQKHPFKNATKSSMNSNPEFQKKNLPSFRLINFSKLLKSG
jgi:hypothetical protein